MRGLALVAGVICSGPASASALPEDFTVEGRLTASAGLPLTTAVDFQFEIYDETSPSCVIYREIRSDVDLTSSDASAQGVFSFRLGAVPPQFTAVPFATLFAPGSIAGDGCTITAPGGSHRLVRVSVRNHGDPTFEALAPDTRVTSVPLAKVSENALALQGVGTSALAQLNPATALSQGNLESVFSTTNYPVLAALLAGSSNLYQSSAPTAAVDLNHQRATNLADPAAAQDATTKAYVDRSLAGRPIDVSTIGPMVGGDYVLKWDQVHNGWVAAAETRQPLGPAGGDLAGSYPNPGLAAGAVATNKLADSAVTTVKLTGPGFGPNRLLITDATSGATVALGTCPINQVYAWSTLGWACSTVGALAPVTTVAGRTGAITLAAADVSGLGTSALFDFGTAAAQMVRLDASASLPAVDGSHLTNLNAVKLQGQAVTTAAPTAGQVLTFDATTSAWVAKSLANGTVTSVTAGAGLLGGTITAGGTLAIDVGTTANKIVQLTAGGKLPGLDGSSLSNVNAFKLASQNVATVVPSVGQVMTFAGGGTGWTPATPATGSVTNVTAGVGLLGGSINASGTIAADVGTTSNKLVQLNGSAQIPAVDGALVKNLNASNLSSGVIAATLLPTLTPAMFGTQTANTVLVAPSGANGAPTFRALGSADLPAGTVSGSASAGFVPKFSATSTLNASPLFVSGSAIGVNKTTPTVALDVVGSIATTLDVAATGAVRAAGPITAGGFLMATLNSASVPAYDAGAFAASWNRSQGGAEVNLWNTFRDPTTAFQFSKRSAGAPGYTDLMTILGNGNVGIGVNNPSVALDVNGYVRAANYYYTSDRRLKTEIRVLEGAVDRIARLRGVTYVWKDPARGLGPQIGFVAQEVEEIYPELVHTDADGMKAVDYAHLVSPLVEAVKTLKRENDDLRARLERLERRLDP